MQKHAVSVADAKAHFSELINRVAYGQDEIVITKRGKPVAVIKSASAKGLASAKGWLEEDDAFFSEMKGIVEKRHSRKLRAKEGIKK